MKFQHSSLGTSICGRRIAALSSMLFVLCTTSCGERSGDGKVGGETNFLSPCDSDVDCAEGSCQCGYCTLTCADPDACRAVKGSICSSQAPGGTAAACGEPTAVPVCIASDASGSVQSEGGAPIQVTLDASGAPANDDTEDRAELLTAPQPSAPSNQLDAGAPVDGAAEASSSERPPSPPLLETPEDPGLASQDPLPDAPPSDGPALNPVIPAPESTPLPQEPLDASAPEEPDELEELEEPEDPLLPEPAAAALAGLAFNMKFDPDVESYSCIGDCQPATLVVEAVEGDRLHALWGTTRNVQRVTMSRVDGAWQAEGILLGRDWLRDVQYDNTELNSARFQFGIEADDTISVTVYGNATSYMYEWMNYSRAFSFAMHGSPDALLPAASVPMDPIPITAPLYLPLNKPLLPGASARLVSQQGETLELAATVVEEFTVAFSSQRVLPLDTEYTLEVDGVDFANVGSPALAPLRTQAGFGVIEDPSFESGSTEGVLGGSIVELDLPPSEPSESLLYGEPGARVLLRLPANPTAQELHFDARIATDCDPAFRNGIDPVSVTFSALIVGEDRDSITPVTLPMNQVNTPLAIGDGDFSVDTFAEELVIPLGGSTTGDVILTFQGSSQTRHVCRRSGALIDNVRLE